MEEKPINLNNIMKNTEKDKNLIEGSKTTNIEKNEISKELNNPKNNTISENINLSESYKKEKNLHHTDDNNKNEYITNSNKDNKTQEINEKINNNNSNNMNNSKLKSALKGSNIKIKKIKKEILSIFNDKVIMEQLEQLQLNNSPLNIIDDFFKYQKNYEDKIE